MRDLYLIWHFFENRQLLRGAHTCNTIVRAFSEHIWSIKKNWRTLIILDTSLQSSLVASRSLKLMAARRQTGEGPLHFRVLVSAGVVPLSRANQTARARMGRERALLSQKGLAEKERFYFPHSFVFTVRLHVNQYWWLQTGRTRNLKAVIIYIGNTNVLQYAFVLPSGQ